MKSHLMSKDRDFDVSAPALPLEDATVQDLELENLIAAMAVGDKWLAEVGRKALLQSVSDLETITYRQDVVKDALRYPAVVREIYELAVSTIDAERKSFYGLVAKYPNSILHRSVDVLRMLVGALRRLRSAADDHIDEFASEGFRTLFRMLQAELSDEYFAAVERHLKLLQFRKGVLISARLGEGCKGVDYVLRAENPPQGSWMTRLLGPKPPSYSYRLPDRDENGSRALGELSDRGVNLVANALAQSTDHVVSFFAMLKTELAFYVGCINLRERLKALNAPLCFPTAYGYPALQLDAAGLYDVSLALHSERAAVGNDLSATGRQLIIITGANQGGKSTWLRSVGLAQLMMQAGMFVGAERFDASVCEHLFTHYKREEDAEMNSGKFDEELKRMSEIVDHLVPNSIVLFNESFASTNEREGAEIARQVVSALTQRGFRIFFVTHQYEFAEAFHVRPGSQTLFLRAERRDSGDRTFKIIEGKPLRTSYGEDLYRRIFLSKGDQAKAAPVPLPTREQLEPPAA